MREGWERAGLRDLAIIETGKWDANHAVEGGAYRFYTCAAEYVFCNTKRFSGNCLVFPGNGANVGEVYFYNGEFDAYQRTYVLHSISQRLLPRLLYYHFLSNWKSVGTAKQYGAATNFIKIGNFNDYCVSFPSSLPEQQRIVDILDQEFAMIDALKANAEKSLQAAKGLFQATLKKELEPREGWKRIMLKDVAVVRVGPFGSSLHKNDYISGGIPLVNPIHMKDGQVVPAVDFSVNQEKLNELRSYILKKGDVVFARRGEIGRCALITDKEDGFLCGTGSLFIRFTQRANSKFMMALFNSPYVKEQLLSKATGATMLNINSTSVENLEMYLPTETEQEEILSCIDDLNDKCRSLQENCQKTLAFCDGLKQSLLRKAFNGEIS